MTMSDLARGLRSHRLLANGPRSLVSEVLDKADTAAPGVGALRLRLVATKGRDESMTLRGEDGKYASGVLLDLDIWALCPR